MLLSRRCQPPRDIYQTIVCAPILIVTFVPRGPVNGPLNAVTCGVWVEGRFMVVGWTLVAQRLFLRHVKGRSGTFQTLARGGKPEEEVGMAAAVATALRALCFDPT